MYTQMFCVIIPTEANGQSHHFIEQHSWRSLKFVNNDIEGP